MEAIANDITNNQQIPADPFEQLCQKLKDRLSNESPDEDGIIRISISDLDDFWKEHRNEHHNYEKTDF